MVGGPQTIQSGLKTIPRLVKKQEKRRLADEKKQRRRERSAGSPSMLYRSTGRERVEWKPKPKPVVSILEPVAKVPSERDLASIATKLKNYDEGAYTYKRLQDPRNDPKVLALEVVNSSFMTWLVKYKGYDYAQLMESVIVEYIRVERPTVQQTPAAAKVRKLKRPLYASQLRQVQIAAAQPSTNMASAITKRGAPKRVPSREKYRDPQIVQDALDKLLKGNPTLMAMFWSASPAEAKRLMPDNRHIQRLVEGLKGELAAPRRTYNYLAMAVKVLIPRYKQEQLAAAQKTAQKAEALRQERIAAATAIAGARERDRRKAEYYTRPLTSEDWRELNRA